LKILVRRFTHNLINSCLAAIFTLAVLLPLAEPVNAAALRQAVVETVVQVSPSALDIPIGDRGTISLEVLGGVEINAYDVTVRYDPALITFVSWSHGSYLSNLAQVYKVDEPGKLRLVFTQLATPPVSGDGILLNLDFSGAAEGVSEVLIEALDFAGADGTITNPQLIGGTIFVSAAQPTAEPTITLPPPTSTETLLPVVSTAAITATQGVKAIATPDLKRTSRVMGTATPTRRLAVVTTLAGASTDFPTGVATEIASVASLYPPPNSTPVAVPTAAPETGLVEMPSDGLLNLALWAALGVFAIAFVWLALIAIRRNKTKSSDKE
jgi:hypothetical protein